MNTKTRRPATKDQLFHISHIENKWPMNRRGTVLLVLCAMDEFTKDQALTALSRLPNDALGGGSPDIYWHALLATGYIVGENGPTPK